MKYHAAVVNRIAILAAIVFTGCFSQSKSTASAASRTDGAAFASALDSANWSTTETKPVTDPVLNRTAYTVHIPAGWKFTGMLERISGCHGTAVPADGLAFTTLAPDGVTAIEKLPGTSWSWVSDGTSVVGPKCAPVKINTAAEFLLNIAVPNLRPDAKNITVVPFTAEMKQQLADAQQRIGSQNSQTMKRTADAARVRLQYTLKGRPVEEILFAIISCQEIDMPAYPMLHRAAVERHICSSNGVAIRRAPQGKLDPLIGKQLPPPEIDSQWDQEVQQKMRQQFTAWQQQNDEQFRAIQNHYKEVTDGMIQKGKEFQAQQKSSFDNAMAQDRATQGAIDHAAQMQVRDSLNRQDFIDPNTGRKIETSNQYTHNWISSDGQSVVLNSDPTLDPNGLIDPVRQSWTELIPVN
jgi:polyhydroxyalkanoate synthesis regulator phasin